MNKHSLTMGDITANLTKPKSNNASALNRLLDDIAECRAIAQQNRELRGKMRESLRRTNEVYDRMGIE